MEKLKELLIHSTNLGSHYLVRTGHEAKKVMNNQKIQENIRKWN